MYYCCSKRTYQSKNLIKIDIALAKGNNKHDQRIKIKEKDVKKQLKNLES